MVLQSNDARNESHEEASPTIVATFSKVRVERQDVAGEMYLHGAHVTSWQPAGAQEVLFVSEHTRWENGRAIRGGIPVCFPWFGNKPDDARAPAHGFVRTEAWQLESVASGLDEYWRLPVAGAIVPGLFVTTERLHRLGRRAGPAPDRRRRVSRSRR